MVPVGTTPDTGKDARVCKPRRQTTPRDSAEAVTGGVSSDDPRGLGITGARQLTVLVQNPVRAVAQLCLSGF